MLLLHQMVGGFYSPPSSWKIKASFTNLWHHAGLPPGCHLFLTFLSFSWPSLLSLLWLTFCFNFQLSTSPILACHCYVIGLQRQCHSTALGQHRDQLGSRGNSGCTRQETEWDLGPHVGHRGGQSVAISVKRLQDCTQGTLPLQLRHLIMLRSKVVFSLLALGELKTRRILLCPLPLVRRKALAS